MDNFNVMVDVGWRFFNNIKEKPYNPRTCGKWMFYHDNHEYLEKLCLKAMKNNITDACKHSLKNDNQNVACFYSDLNDTENHRKILLFFKKNHLIPVLDNGNFENIGFKLDAQTRHHKNNFKPYIEAKDIYPEWYTE